MVEVLLRRGASVETKNRAGDNALMPAVIHDRHECVALLLDVGAADTDARMSKARVVSLLRRFFLTRLASLVTPARRG